MGDIRQDWIDGMRKDGFKYFVIKVEEFLNNLTPMEALSFYRMLESYNKVRQKEGKDVQKYWVLNRTDYDIESYEDLHNELKMRELF